MMIDINEYFFSEISAKANESFFAEIEKGPFDRKIPPSDFEYSIDQWDEEGRLIMRMTVSSVETESRATPYQFQLEVIGSFALESSPPNDEAYSLSLSAAAALLYGALRERLISITQSMPFRAVYLPMMTFLFDREEKEPADK